jgi:hypothetical protein
LTSLQQQWSGGWKNRFSSIQAKLKKSRGGSMPVQAGLSDANPKQPSAVEQPEGPVGFEASNFRTPLNPTVLPRSASSSRHHAAAYVYQQDIASPGIESSPYAHECHAGIRDIVAVEKFSPRLCRFRAITWDTQLRSPRASLDHAEVHGVLQIKLRRPPVGWVGITARKRVPYGDIGPAH